MTFDSALFALGSAGAGPRHGGGDALYAPVVFRSAPRGPGGVAGPRLDREDPSGLPATRLRVAVFFVAAVVLVMSNGEQPTVQPFKRLLPIPMADTRLEEPQGAVPVPHAEGAVEGRRRLAPPAVRGAAAQAAPKQAEVERAQDLVSLGRPEEPAEVLDAGAGVLQAGAVGVRGD